MHSAYGPSRFISAASIVLFVPDSDSTYLVGANITVRSHIFIIIIIIIIEDFYICNYFININIDLYFYKNMMA